MNIISLGAGVQSSTMALMAAHGEITPMPDCAIFADTQAEPKAVYEWLDWLEKQLPFTVYRVTAGSLTEKSLTTKTNRKTGQPYYSNMIPAFIKNTDGTKGIIQRHCTWNHKIIPIQRKTRHLARIKRGEKEVQVSQWIGISTDEAGRMKDARVPWIKHRWPLIELGIRRNDCLLWMERHGYGQPPRSACVYCPFHSDHEWRNLLLTDAPGFAEAVRVEKALQHLHRTTNPKGRTVGTPFLHASLKPLDQVDFSTDEDRGQLNMFNNECEGMCGV